MHTVSLGIWVPVQVSLILTSVLTRTWPVSHCLSVRVSFSSPPTPLLPRFCLPRPRLLMSPSPGQQGFHGSVSACTLIRTELLGLSYSVETGGVGHTARTEHTKTSSSRLTSTHGIFTSAGRRGVGHSSSLHFEGSLVRTRRQ